MSETHHATDVTEREPNAGLWSLTGYLIGLVVSCAAITIVGTVGGMGFASALGLGAFIGIWGGGGFGFMMGGVFALARELDGPAHEVA